MEFDPPEANVAVRDVLPTLGFVAVWGTPTDQEPAFALRVGSLDITAAEVTSLYFRREFMFSGAARTTDGRALNLIEFTMPLAVESTDQAIAWLAYGIGRDVVPTQPVEWFELGKQMQDLLPWRQQVKRYQERRQSRPRCRVGREWMRLVVGSLRAAAESASGQDEFTIDFDGDMLKIFLRGTVTGAPARGDAWTQRYRGRVASLTSLPRRLMTDPVEVGVWEDRLEIGSARFVVDPEASGGNAV